MKKKSAFPRIGPRFISMLILAAAIVLLLVFHKDGDDMDSQASPGAQPAIVAVSGGSTGVTPKTNKNPLPSGPLSYPAPPAVSAAAAKIVFDLPYVLNGSANADWIGNWGMLSGANGTLDFGASSSTTGGAAFLNGSASWTNYDAEANVRWEKGESFGIVARMSDPGNFIYCNFGDRYVRALSRVNGNDAVLSEGVAPNGAAGSSGQLGIRVYGGKMACTVDGKDVVTASGKGIPAAGGIGLLSWDPVTGNSEIVVTGLSVSPLQNDDIVLAPPSSAAPAAGPPPPPLALPYKKNNFTNDADWQATWGTTAIGQDGSMGINATDSTTGASVMLADADVWGDYQFSATLDWTKGETFGLIARYQDDNNYTICLFDQQYAGTVHMQLQQHVNGNVVTLVAGDITDYNQLRGSDIAASIEVRGEEGSCSFAGHAVLSQGSGNHLSIPYAGGPGFTIWDPTADNAGIVVRSVDIEAVY